MARKLNITNLKPLQQIGESKTIRYIKCRILIVCEGEKTEPMYFKSFNMVAQPSDSLVFNITTDGGKINTMQVVNKAIEMKSKAEQQGQPYDAVWVVFDKDDFQNCEFDNAIKEADRKNIGCAWSNEAFELWYVYHFDDRNTAMKREEYQKIITQRIRKCGYKSGKEIYQYKKNDPNMRNILRACNCNELDAVKRAERQANSFSDMCFHNHNPCTMVYKLVKLLLGEDKDFIDKIKKELEEK